MLPLIRKGGTKKIINMSSGNGVPSCIREMKLQGRWPYATSKGALDIALIRLSNELRPERFTVVSISPAVVIDRAGAEEKGSCFHVLSFCVRISSFPGPDAAWTRWIRLHADLVNSAQVLTTTSSKQGLEPSLVARGCSLPTKASKLCWT